MGVRAEVGSIPALDGVRGIAVLWVIAFHYAALRPEAADPWLRAINLVPLLDAVVRNGYLGVDLFFLLSGFLLSLPWLIRADAGQPPPDLRDFYARRVRRIVPAYYVQLLLLLLLFIPLLRGWDYWKRDLYVILWNGVSHGLFLHTTSPLTSGSLGVNGALWTLAVEAQFYLLLPLLAPFLARAPLTATAIAFVLAGLWQAGARHDLQWLVAWQMRLGEHWGWPESIIRHLLLTQLPSYLAHFALGALLARVWMVLRDKYIERGWMVLAVLGSLAMLLFTLASPTAVAGEQTWVVTTLALGMLLLAAAATLSNVARRALGSGALAFVGRVSYSAYLYHLPLLLLWNHYAGAIPPVLSAPLYVVLVMLAAWLSWRFIEQRFVRASPR